MNNEWMENGSLLGSQRRLSCEFRLRDMEKGFSRQFLKETKGNEASVFIQSLICNNSNLGCFMYGACFWFSCYVLVNKSS